LGGKMKRGMRKVGKLERKRKEEEKEKGEI
jgi:hypothetical protein